MNNTTTIELKNIDSEDISDMLLKVEESFGFKFGKTELKDVITFGELCDIITNKVLGDNTNDCTTQQAFYKLRKAISATLLIDKENITIDTDLQEFFPRRNRRQKIKELQRELGFSIDVLDIKEWMSWTIVLGFILSIIMFFFNWQIALSGLTFSILFSWTAIKFFATELELLTVGQLAEKISREDYFKARRNPTTVNRNEIAQKVKELFSKDLELEESALTRQATFV